MTPLLPTTQALLLGSSSTPKRTYLLQYLPKYRDHYKPKWFNNPVRRWDTELKNRKYQYFDSDPLYFDHKQFWINGGIRTYIDHIHDSNKYNLPLKQMSYVLYNMTRADIHDPTLFEEFEKHYLTTSSHVMSGRIAFGAIYAYIKSNQGTMFGLDFWTVKLQDYIDDMRAFEIIDLLEAFRHNRRLHRSHMKDLMDKYFKERVLLQWWNREIRYNQRVLFDLATELDLLQWYDEEIWTKIFDTTVEKKKINNSHDFKMIHNMMYKLNHGGGEKSPYKHLAGKFDQQIEGLLKRHYTENRQWKYDAETRKDRPYQDLLDRRDDLKIDDERLVRTWSEVDQSTIETAREAEKKLKRLTMAKYSRELFDEIIEGMMREKRTILEMMAELDCGEAEVYASQTRIAKIHQTKVIQQQMEEQKANKKQ